MISVNRLGKNALTAAGRALGAHQQTHQLHKVEIES